MIFQKMLAEMENSEFEKFKESLAVHRLEKPKKLSEECSRYWLEITKQQYNFDRGTPSLISTVTITSAHAVPVQRKQ